MDIRELPKNYRQFVKMVEAVNAFADVEGWAIFNLCEIQRDDELDIFPGDEEAAEHVKRLADAGSALHKKTLELLKLAPAIVGGA